jgi:hypothetical protein
MQQAEDAMRSSEGAAHLEPRLDLLERRPPAPAPSGDMTSAPVCAVALGAHTRLEGVVLVHGELAAEDTLDPERQAAIEPVWRGDQNGGLVAVLEEGLALPATVAHTRTRTQASS